MSSFADLEGGLKAFLRADAGVAALVGQRVFLGMPERCALPAIDVRLLADVDDTSDAPIQQALVEFSCWADSKPAALDVARAVRAALFDTGPVDVGTDTHLYGGSVVGFLPIDTDPSRKRRYVVTASVTARAA